jgi:hypothetical protein
MTPQQIRDAVAASASLQALAVNRNDTAIAEALSAGRTKVASRFTSARGVLERYPLGPVAADAVLSKLEAFSNAGHPLSSIVKRAVTFLNQPDGIDLGSGATLAMLNALTAGGVLTTQEHDGLVAIATVANPVPVLDVSNALNEVTNG